MLTSNQTMIGGLASFPQKLKETLQNIRPDQLDMPYREGSWTVRQVVHHLADSHLNAYIRMKLILTEDHPTLKPYNQDDWAKQGDASGDDIDSSLLILEGLHTRMSSFLSKVKDEDWERSAFHPEDGEVTLLDLLKIYTAHCENHLRHIEQVTQVNR